MKTNLKLLFISAMVIFMASCAKSPEAEFTASKQTVEEGEEITFTVTGENVASVEWDFGDGSNSTEISPKKIYTKEGTYSVKLTAFSKKEKKSDESTMTIKVVFPEVNVKGNFGASPFNVVITPDIEGGNGGNYSLDSETFNHRVSYSSFIYDNKIEKGLFSIHIGTLYFSDSFKPSESEFENFFKIGSFPYAMDAVDGVEISCYANGEAWNSSYGSGAQAGSTFKIISKTPSNKSIFGDQVISVKCEFNCKMYNENGDSKNFSGTCVMNFAKV